MNRSYEQMELLTERYPVLKPMEKELKKAADLLIGCFASGGKLLIGGNGGSAADAQHMAGELVKSFKKRRPVPEEYRKRLYEVAGDRAHVLAEGLQRGLPALALSGQEALLTASANDISWDLAYAQQVYGYGRAGDVLLAVSTSGNSRNLIYAADAARALDMKVIALTGKDGGTLAGQSDLALIVPCHETYQIQELHLPIYHALCLEIEAHFFDV